MRIATLALLATLAVPPSAQPVPDTTAPWRYHPMGVGDVWEYAYWADPWEGSPYLDHYERLRVVGDTAVGDTLYAMLMSTHFALNGTPGQESRQVVRFDPAHSVFVERHPVIGAVPWGGPSEPWACRLDQGFPADSTAPISDLCYAWGMSSGPTHGNVSGGYERTISIGSQSVSATVKRYRAFVGVDIWMDYAAGIGLIYSEANELGGFYRVMGYALIGGVTYGTPLVAGEPGPGPDALSVGISPNPSTGWLTLALTLTSPGPIVVEAFDALGRRVHQSETELPAGSHTLPVDAGPWRRGLYILRVTAGGVNVSARVVRR